MGSPPARGLRRLRHQASSIASDCLLRASPHHLTELATSPPRARAGTAIARLTRSWGREDLLAHCHGLRAAARHSYSRAGCKRHTAAALLVTEQVEVVADQLHLEEGLVDGHRFRFVVLLPYDERPVALHLDRDDVVVLLVSGADFVDSGDLDSASASRGARSTTSGSVAGTPRRRAGSGAVVHLAPVGEPPEATFVCPVPCLGRRIDRRRKPPHGWRVLESEW